MRNHRRLLLLLATATFALATAARAQRYVPTANPVFPRLMYAADPDSFAHAGNMMLPATTMP